MNKYQDYRLHRPDYSQYDQPVYQHGGLREGAGRKLDWSKDDYPLQTVRLPKRLADEIKVMRDADYSSQQIINLLRGN